MKYLAEREERTLLKLVKDRKGKRPERDVVLLELAVKTGLRLAEIHGLNVGDIRGMEKLYVRPEIAKRSRPRTLPIHKEMQHILKNFLKLKLQWKEGIHDNDPLFVSRKGNRLSRREIQGLFEKWCIEAGLVFNINGKIEAQYTVHSLRHTFAIRLIQRGSTLPVVQKLLGHSSLASTGIYTEATFEECEEAVNAL
jgi:site-specific recombinase XerD